MPVLAGSAVAIVAVGIAVQRYYTHTQIGGSIAPISGVQISSNTPTTEVSNDSPITVTESVAQPEPQTTPAATLVAEKSEPVESISEDTHLVPISSSFTMQSVESSPSSGQSIPTDVTALSNIQSAQPEIHITVQGYCVKCKAKREMKDPTKIHMKNGRPATQGFCTECGRKMFRIGA